MRRERAGRRALLLMMAMVMASVACARAAREAPGGAGPPPPDLPEVAQAELCGQVQEFTDHAVPEGLRQRFAAGEAEAVLFVQLRGVRRPHQVSFRWYGPNRDLYVDSGAKAIVPMGPFHEAVYVWHGINIAGEVAAALPGPWTVVFTLDDRPVVSRDFEIVR